MLCADCATNCSRPGIELTIRSIDASSRPWSQKPAIDVASSSAGNNATNAVNVSAEAFVATSSRVDFNRSSPVGAASRAEPPPCRGPDPFESSRDRSEDPFGARAWRLRLR